MTDVVGRGTYETALDRTGLQQGLNEAKQDVERTGTETEAKLSTSGERAVTKMGSTAKLAIGAVSVAGTAMFGLATKGALEMESAQGKFQAATGRSREEAIAFTRDMNGLVGTAGTVGTSFDDIAAAGIAVSQQFGVTGDDARTLTEDILTFAKVTGQDAEQAAFQLEDTLSAFNLTAADAGPLMDALVASNQKFGTDAGPKTLSILQGMAPALQTMGMEIGDGVEILNAFETAGIDAGTAQRGLQTAIKELKPGQTFDDLVAEIGAIEDPTARAQRAIEIFGTKAGAGLAQVIRPGMTSLDEFGVTAAESAGKTDKAAQDMLTTTDRFRMFVDKVGGIFRDFGQAFGPMLSAVGSVGSLIAPQLGKAWDAVKDSGVVKSAIGRAGLIVGPLYSGAMKIGEAIGDAIGGAWDFAKSAGRRAIELAGAAAGALYAGAVKVGEAIGDALSAGWDLAQGVARGAIEKAGEFFGRVFVEATSDTVGDVGTGAAGTIIGNLTGNLIQAVTTSWSNVKAWIMGGATGKMIAAVGAASTAVYSAGVAAAQWLIAAVQGLWTRVRGDATLKVAAGAAGAEHGAAYAAGAAAPSNLTRMVGAGKWLIGAGLVVGGTAAAAGAGAAIVGAISNDLAKSQIGNSMSKYGAEMATKYSGSFSGELRTGWEAAFQEGMQGFYDKTGRVSLDVGLLAGKKFLMAQATGLSDPTNWRTTTYEEIFSKIGQQAGQAGGEAVGPALNTAAAASIETAGPPIPEGYGVTWGTDIGRATGTAAGNETMQAWLDSMDARDRDLIISMRLRARAGATGAAAEVQSTLEELLSSGGGRWSKIGGDITGTLARGLATSEAKSQLADQTGTLRTIIENELSPRRDALYAIGREYMRAVQQAMKSEEKDTVDAARSVAVAGINAIEDAGLKGPRSTRRIGQLYIELLNSGMSSLQARSALTAGNVSDATITSLERRFPQFTDAGEEYMNRIAGGIGNKSGTVTAAGQGVLNRLKGLPWGYGGENAGAAWQAGLIRGLRGSEAAVQGVLNKIKANLIGLSPPPEGPLRDIDKGGYNVGRAWYEGLAAGVMGGNLAVPLMGLADALGSSAQGVGGAVATSSVQIDVGGINVTVNGGTGSPAEIGQSVADAVRTEIVRIAQTVIARPPERQLRPV